ncbi:SDR family oxidoreductase [Synechocystis sp. LKSZ1]|uniref:NAD(P)-dependent oxidoreductase n=1 Tax=Synechocystis sp. LKSZ1 TaxID=3144951 RepID=UPI00336BE9B2
MKILIIGASRGIGLKLLEAAIQQGHIVTALARNPEQISLTNERLKIVKGDIRDQNSLNTAMEGQDVVCSCIGIGPTRKPVTIFSEGTKNILTAMKKTGINLFISVTGIGAGDSKGHGGFLYDKLLQPLLLKTIYEDKDRSEEIIKKSDVNWIIVRPGFLTNGLVTGKYRVLTDLTGIKVGNISRADVAHFILNQAEHPQYLQQTPLLTY